MTGRHRSRKYCGFNGPSNTTRARTRPKKVESCLREIIGAGSSPGRRSPSRRADALTVGQPAPSVLTAPQHARHALRRPGPVPDCRHFAKFGYPTVAMPVPVRIDLTDWRDRVNTFVVSPRTCATHAPGSCDGSPPITRSARGTRNGAAGWRNTTTITRGDDHEPVVSVAHLARSSISTIRCSILLSI